MSDTEQITENKTKIEAIQHEMGQVWEVVQELRTDVKNALNQALKRPGWVTTVIITILSSVCMSLITAIIVRGSG